MALTLMISANAVMGQGQKYGLFVGINAYAGGINPLFGCVNDAKNIRSTLTTRYGFRAANTTLLKDSAATREGILGQLNGYRAKVKKGDLFVFHYSGHGTLYPDTKSEDQDETNLTYVEAPNEEGVMEVLYPRAKYDSAIVPVDARSRTSGKPWRNLILDDELYEMFAGFTVKGAQVVFISDSCHSGTIAKAARTDVRVRTSPLHAVFGERRYSDIDFAEPSISRTGKTPQPVRGLFVTLSGAKDNEFALDSSGEALPMGLFTSTLLKNLGTKTANRLTYEKLMSAVSTKVREAASKQDNDQNPQLETRFGNPRAIIFSLPPRR
jgi:hypothetical protein